jgi:xanthine dehydrogenase YagR molybdenum-binding subunit
VRDIQAYWVDDDDAQLNPTGSKGVGEIGIVGAAAAVANAVHHATGVRVRDLPITVDKLVG